MLEFKTDVCLGRKNGFGNHLHTEMIIKNYAVD